LMPTRSTVTESLTTILIILVNARLITSVLLGF
jgi:hypothetical protein